MRTLFPRASRIAAARSALAVLLVGFASAAMAQVPAVDWKAERAEILRHYRALVQIDTSNPPGNETLAANYPGIPVKTFALEPARANLVARIKGNGSKRPVLIMAHTDVVGVQREKWPVDPFAAVAKDGYIWSRGTKDDKDKLTANLITMLLAKRLDVPLDRDLIFLAEAGEEGTSSVGINFMVNEHFDDIDAEFAITEGGGATLEEGRVTVVNIQTTEKVPRGARLVASGTSGHGSVPRVDNPLVHLSAASAKVGAWETPIRLNDTTRLYFERLAGISPPDKAERYRALLDPQRAASVQRYFAENEPQRYSMLRTSIVPTILKGPMSSRRKRKRRWTSAPCRMKTCPSSSRR